jgi:hypothetical protein
MHTIIDKKFYLGLNFGTLFIKKWITILSCYKNSTGMQQNQ